MTKTGQGALAILAASFMTAAVGTSAAQAQSFKSLHGFAGTPDGDSPTYGSLIQATNGDLYGATVSGGANGNGTVFKITANGALTTVYSFCSESTCGQNPNAGLVQASNGNFYGTTSTGGTNTVGTVFKMTPGGTVTTLHSFCSQSGCADGSTPFGGLVQGANGDFYGTTNTGGIGGAGTVFKIAPSGTLTTLHHFVGADGDGPFAGLVQAANGDFYGTTESGGAHSSGTVFEITPAGKFTMLYSFCAQGGIACTDGAYPYAGLVQGTDLNFYGTTFNGGVSTNCGGQGCGSVFQITPAGALTTIYSFCSQYAFPLCLDGLVPYGGVIQATDGKLYGATNSGGANNGGTVFHITLSGTLTTLYDFCAVSQCKDGYMALSALTQDTNGKLYGTTSAGGASNDGTVFSLSMGLGAFVETRPASGKVGAAVKILGTSLTGATGVSFNGVAAVFTVVSASEIATTVPTGATTGTIEVTTPVSTLSSNVQFQVQ